MSKASPSPFPLISVREKYVLILLLPIVAPVSVSAANALLGDRRGNWQTADAQALGSCLRRFVPSCIWCSRDTFKRRTNTVWVNQYFVTSPSCPRCPRESHSTRPQRKTALQEAHRCHTPVKRAHSAVCSASRASASPLDE